MASALDWVGHLFLMVMLVDQKKSNNKKQKTKNNAELQKTISTGMFHDRQPVQHTLIFRKLITFGA